jgi:hypothetical protein
MTKLRTPNSIEDAVHQSIAVLGDEAISRALTNQAAGVTVSTSLVAKWSDPEAPQRIGLHQALGVEALLLKAGHAPIFLELFRRLAVGVEPGGQASPLESAVQATISAAELLKATRESLQDGELQPHEVSGVKSKLSALQRELAALNRSLVVKRKKT